MAAGILVLAIPGWEPSIVYVLCFSRGYLRIADHARIFPPSMIGSEGQE